MLKAEALAFAFDQIEPSGEVACGGGLQEEGGADGEGDHGDGDLRSLHALRQQQACDGGGDDARLPAPAYESDLFFRPSTAAVGEEAGEDGYGAGHEDKDEHYEEAAQEVSAQGLEREV